MATPTELGGQFPVGPDATTAQLENWMVQGLPGTPDWDDMPKEARMEAKRQIVEELVKRTGLDSMKINRFVQQWALTAHDEDMRSLAIHRDAAELFGMKLPDYTSQKIAEVEEDLESIFS